MSGWVLWDLPNLTLVLTWAPLPAAVLDGDDYVLNGTKVFITNAGLGHLYVVLVRTGDKDAKHGNTSYIVVEKGTLASLWAKGEKLGIRSSLTYEPSLKTAAYRKRTYRFRRRRFQTKPWQC